MTEMDLHDFGLCIQRHYTVTGVQLQIQWNVSECELFIQVSITVNDLATTFSSLDTID